MPMTAGSARAQWWRSLSHLDPDGVRRPDRSIPPIPSVRGRVPHLAALHAPPCRGYTHMPENAPNPPPSPAPGIPPVDPNALVATALAVLKTPAEFFKSIKDDKGFQKPLTFSVAVWAVYAILRLLYPLFHLQIGSVIGTVIVAAICAFLVPFVGGIIIW